MVLAGKQVLGEKSFPLPLYPHKSHVDWHGIKRGPLQYDAGD
jgi:hypothetical protein